MGGIREQRVGVCLEVIDGDTVWMEIGGERVLCRLIGIDAWETHENQRLIRQVLAWKRRGYGVSYERACDWGTNGWKHLSNLLPIGAVVNVHTYGLDRYGRHLVSLYVPGRWVNEEMIASGWAMVYLVSDNMPREKRQRLRNAREAAQTARKGMWAVLE